MAVRALLEILSWEGNIFVIFSVKDNIYEFFLPTMVKLTISQGMSSVILILIKNM